MSGAFQVCKRISSLGRFGQDGYKFTAENGHLKIAKGALIVGRGELQGNLYWLVGDTVIDDAIMVNNETNSVMTWYRQLRYMSKHGLKVLLNLNLLPGCKFRFV